MYWLGLIVLMIINSLIAYVYNRFYVKKQKHIKNKRVNFLKCTIYYYTKDQIGNGLFISNIIFGVVLITQTILLIIDEIVHFYARELFVQINVLMLIYFCINLWIIVHKYPFG